VVFAFQVLPIVIFIASFFSILYYLGVMRIFVRAMAKLMQRVMGASGAESTDVAASIFMGQTEAPLTIRPFLPGLTQSELFTVMVAGMAHVSGAGDGLQLALNIGAMLVAFLALIAMVNGVLNWAHGLPWMGWLPSSLERFFGLVFAPVAWLMGVSWKDAPTVGNLLGTRMVLNEFVAFLQLGPIKAQLDPRSFTIATYALCGFANFSSIAIQIGGIGALAPSRKSDLARLGLKAMAAGTMANFMSACIAGMLL
jgi:CNT family concentrative nucleoside transporter